MDKTEILRQWLEIGYNEFVLKAIEETGINNK